MELKEGMYVRYVPTVGEYTQKISKITKIENRLLDMAYYLDNDSEELYSSHFDEITNASFNLIDLIEVGDYVNGEYVDLFAIDFFKDHPEYIKSIVTKEQFEAMKYVVERNE